MWRFWRYRKVPEVFGKLLGALERFHGGFQGIGLISSGRFGIRNVSKGLNATSEVLKVGKCSADTFMLPYVFESS